MLNTKVLIVIFYYIILIFILRTKTKNEMHINTLVFGYRNQIYNFIIILIKFNLLILSFF